MIPRYEKPKREKEPLVTLRWDDKRTTCPKCRGEAVVQPTLSENYKKIICLNTKGHLRDEPCRWTGYGQVARG